MQFFVVDFMWCLVVKALSWSMINLFHRQCKDFIGYFPEIHLLYAAKKAIGPRQFTEEDARETARRAFQKNPRLTSAEIGKAIGRARRTVDSYIADLKAATRLGMDLKIFCMNSLGIPQDRIAKRLGQTRETVRDHLAKMAVLPNPPNADLSRGFTVSQVAEKHACPACRSEA